METATIQERTGLLFKEGQPLTLLGNAVQVGDMAPDFKIIDNNLNTVTLNDFKSEVLVLTALPSLDTPVCDSETMRFNKEAENLPDEVEIAIISTDLPYGQARWVRTRNIEKVSTFSDHMETSFGLAYGILIKELRILARAIFIVDPERRIRYIQMAKELNEDPDYDEVLEKIHEVTGG